MIARLNRFHGHGSLSPLYRRGQSVSLSLVSLKHLPVRTDKPGRLAVVVSRKVDKSAVVRNRIRRRIYEDIRVKSPKLTQGVDLVITVHNQQVAGMKATELSEIIYELLIKASLLEP